MSSDSNQETEQLSRDRQPQVEWPPSKLSDLLSAVVADCRAVEELQRIDVARGTPNRFEWDMDLWFTATRDTSDEDVSYIEAKGVGVEPFSNDEVIHCSLCVAGATMLMRRTPHGTWADAVDAMRQGLFVTAFKYFSGDDAIKIDDSLHLFEVERLFQNVYLGGSKTRSPVPPSKYLTWDEYDQIAAALRGVGL